MIAQEIPIQIEAFGMVTRSQKMGLEELEISGKIETIQNTVMLSSS